MPPVIVRTQSKIKSALLSIAVIGFALLCVGVLIWVPISNHQEDQRVKAAISKVCPGAKDFAIHRASAGGRGGNLGDIEDTTWKMPDGHTLTWTKASLDDTPTEVNTGCLRYWNCTAIDNKLSCDEPK
jgi:hypothetical protein